MCFNSENSYKKYKIETSTFRFEGEVVEEKILDFVSIYKNCNETFLEIERFPQWKNRW